VIKVEPEALGTQRHCLGAFDAACLGAWLALLGLRRDLGGFARLLAGLNFPNRLKIVLLRSFKAIPHGKVYKNVYVLAK